jgi:hypothetical protein
MQRRETLNSALPIWLKYIADLVINLEGIPIFTEFVGNIP